MTEIERLRVEWSAMFDRLLEAGRADGRRIATEAMRAALSGLVPASADASSPTPSVTMPLIPKIRGKRAAIGAVQEIVQAILEGSPVPLSPLSIVQIGSERGTELNPSSVRMALQTLRKKDLAESANRGEWRLKRTLTQTEQMRAALTSNIGEPAPLPDDDEI